MKLANVELSGVTRAVAVIDEEVVDLTAALGSQCDEIGKILRLGPTSREHIMRCVKGQAPRLPKRAVRFRSPIRRAEKILGVGMNYRSFIAAAQRVGIVVPKERLWFYRPNACIAGPYDDVWLPRDANDFDFEAELAVVIGRRCRYVSPADAPAMIAGFTVANDLTLRSRVFKSLVAGKSFDTHMPIGPWIVTPDEIGDPHKLEVRTWVNGKLYQDSNTSDMITDCYHLVADVSAACTLNPGDIILTGTPAGSGIFQTPPISLSKGDVVKIEIEGIGAIENRVIDEVPLEG